MDLTVEEFIKNLLSEEAHEQPSDSVKKEELVLELPKDFDEKKFNQGRRFFWDHSVTLTGSMLTGLMAVFAVPSILRVLVGTRRSNSPYTAYRRYLSTLLHTVTWFEHDLKPGSTSWKSLYTVRSRHLQAGLASKMKGTGVVSQRDIALTQFGFVGFSILKPDNYGIRQMKEGDWEAYNYFWRVICHMIGLEDRYNICRETIEETREVCQILLDRVFTPCLDNAPEYFEHMARVMLEGMWTVNPTIQVETNMYYCKYIANVPGYIITEKERIQLQRRIKDKLNGKSLDTGIDSSLLIEAPMVEGLPERPPHLLYYHDYDTIETAPAYKRLTLIEKYKLVLITLYATLYKSFIFRIYFNIIFNCSLYLMRYLPYMAFFKFGVKESYVNIFKEDPTDDCKPKMNSEFYKEREPETWYQTLWSFIW